MVGMKEVGATEVVVRVGVQMVEGAMAADRVRVCWVERMLFVDQ